MANTEPLTPELQAELAALEALNVAPDTSDAPGVTDWTGAKRGVFYRPNEKGAPNEECA